MELVKLCKALVISFMITTVLSQEETNSTLSLDPKKDDDLVVLKFSNTDQTTIAINVLTTDGPALPNDDGAYTEPTDTQILGDDLIISHELDSPQTEPNTEKYDVTTLNYNEVLKSLKPALVSNQSSNIANETLNEIIPESTKETTSDFFCPVTCYCYNEIDSANLQVDCSNRNLTEVPKLDPSTSILNIQYNLLSEIPASISNLKQLRVLNASNNRIEKIVNGSIGNLSALKILNLSNNKLFEFPDELKYSIALNNLDIGGNDIKVGFTIDKFENMKSLKKLTLPSSEKEFVKVLCNTYNNTIQLDCVGFCDDWTNGCIDRELEANTESDLTSSELPVLKELDKMYPDNNNETDNESTDIPKDSQNKTTNETNNANNTDSIRNVLIKLVTENNLENIEEVGATTSVITNTGSIDKNVIGIVLGCMIVLVAAIAIKMNWNSLAKKFGSNRNNTATTTNTNGVLPEEVPLQEKDQPPPV